MSATNADPIEVIPYQELSSTAAFRAAPRFGHRSTFSDVFSNDPQVIGDYVAGLLFIGAFCLAVFLIWFIVLLVYRTCVPASTAGFLTGAKFTNPKRAFRVRITYTVATLLWIIFTVLLVTEGITSLKDTVLVVQDTSADISALTDSAAAIASQLEAVGQTTEPIRDALVENLGNFCPNNEDQVQTVTGVNITAEARMAVEMLGQLQDFVRGDLGRVRDGIETAREVTGNVDKGVENVQIEDWQALIILIPWILIPSIMLVGVGLAYFNVSHKTVECVLAWVFVPLLVMMTIVSIALAVAVSVLAVGNADVCSGGTGVDLSPDETVFDFLAAQGYSSDDMVVRAVQYYVNQCRNAVNDPFDFIGTYQTQIQDAQDIVVDLDLSIESVGINQLELLCGDDKNFQQIAGLTEQMKQSLRDLASAADQTLELLQCSNIVPLYTNTVYDGTCNYSITGVTWTFSAFLVISFMGMLMIMFRSSIYELDEDPEDFVPKNEFGGMETMGVPISNYAQEEDTSKLQMAATGAMTQDTLEQAPPAAYSPDFVEQNRAYIEEYGDEADDGIVDYGYADTETRSNPSTKSPADGLDEDDTYQPDSYYSSKLY